MIIQPGPSLTSYYVTSGKITAMFNVPKNSSWKYIEQAAKEKIKKIYCTLK